MEKSRQFWSNTTALEVLEDIDLTDKTFLITGTTSGIGIETAKSLALKGAHVVMANRNLELSEQIRDEIYEETQHRKIDIIQMNLSFLESIRKAVKEFLSKNWPLHALILSAGIFAPADKATADGFEMTFGTNHLGHFYLTYLLLDKLRESAPSRVVIVSSRFHNYTEVNNTYKISPSMPIEEKLSCLVQPPDTTASTYKTYAYSKLCNVLFAFKLHELENKNGINTYVLHPGSMIGTRIWRNWGLFGTIANFLLKPFVKSLQQGAATTVYCVASPHVENESSQYYEDCWISEKSLCVDLAHDKVLQNALWEKSIEFVKNFENKCQY